MNVLFSSKNCDFNNETAVFVCQWLRNQLRRPDEKDQANAIISLMKLLQKDAYRQIFTKEEGIPLYELFDLILFLYLYLL